VGKPPTPAPPEPPPPPPPPKADHDPFFDGDDRAGKLRKEIKTASDLEDAVVQAIKEAWEKIRDGDKTITVNEAYLTITLSQAGTSDWRPLQSANPEKEIETTISRLGPTKQNRIAIIDRRNFRVVTK